MFPVDGPDPFSNSCLGPYNTCMLTLLILTLFLHLYTDKGAFPLHLSKKSKVIDVLPNKPYFFLMNFNSTCYQLYFEVSNVDVGQKLRKLRRY